MGAPGVGTADDDSTAGAGGRGRARGRVRERLQQRAAARRGASRDDADARAATAGWVPPDLVMAAGAGKQRLYLIPSQELVIVRLGPVRGGRAFKDDEFLATLLR